jgi:ankyrin repeat protein
VRNPPALAFAAQQERKDIVEVLLIFGARVNDTDDDGRTACHFAAEGRADLLALLLAHRPNLELKCGKGRNVLETSLACTRYRNSLKLIEAGASLEAVDHGLLCRLAASSTPAIQTLLRHNVAIRELRDRNGRTPLHLAAAEKAPDDVLHMLVNECGVDLEVRNEWGSTCVFSASSSGFGDASALRFLIASGANIHALDEFNRTPLHWIQKGHYAILLLAAGADVNARDNFDRAPLATFAMIEAQKPHATVNLMLAAGADLDAVDRYGETARLVFARILVTFADDDAQAKQVEAARREIGKVRLDFVRHRAWQVCIGLQSRGLDALQMCEILLHSCGPVAPLIVFHQWWKIATTVKHFKL